MRKVTKATDGRAGYFIEGLSDSTGFTYNEATAKRLQYLGDDDALELPADGVLAEVDPDKAPKPPEHHEG
jgi:hypothetical protein